MASTSSASTDMISSNAAPFHFKIADPLPLPRVVVASLRLSRLSRMKLADLVFVLVQEAALAGADVDDVKVVPARVAVVHGDGNEMRIVVVHADQHGVCVGVGREDARHGAVDVDAPEIEILVAGLVLLEQDMRIGAREPMGQDRPLCLPGERARFAQVVARAPPRRS